MLPDPACAVSTAERTGARERTPVGRPGGLGHGQDVEGVRLPLAERGDREHATRVIPGEGDGGVRLEAEGGGDGGRVHRPVELDGERLRQAVAGRHGIEGPGVDGLGLARDGDGVALGRWQTSHHDECRQGSRPRDRRRSAPSRRDREPRRRPGRGRAVRAGSPRASAIRRSSIWPAGGIRGHAETGTRGREPTASQPGLVGSVPSPQPSGQPRRSSVMPPGACARRPATGIAGRSIGPMEARDQPPGSARRSRRRGPGPRATSVPRARSRSRPGGVDELVDRRETGGDVHSPPLPRRRTACRATHRREPSGGRPERGGPGPRAAPGRPATILASGPASRRNARQPATAGSPRRPGTRYRDRPCSRAHAAVVRAPLRTPASTTTVASARPLMIRLRRGNVPRDGCVSGGNSLRTVPPRGRDRPRQGAMRRGIEALVAPADDRHRGRPRTHGRRVGGAIDPERQPRHDRRPRGPPPRPRCARPWRVPPRSAFACPRSRPSAAGRGPHGSPCRNRTGGGRSMMRSRDG